MELRNLFFTIFLAILCVGCSTVENMHRQKGEMMNAYMAGDSDTVQRILDKKLRTPHWYNTSVVRTGDEIPWNLEAGLWNFQQGNFSRAIDYFKRTEHLIREDDDRAVISAKELSDNTLSLVTNLNALPYRAYCRDRIALSMYKAFAYLGEGKEDSFRAQVRRLREEQKEAMARYRDFFETEKKRVERIRESYPSIVAHEATYEASGGFVGSLRQSQPEKFKEMESVANRGYGYLLNPMATFLSGLVNLRDGNPGNALIDFKRLYEAMPYHPLIQQYYVTVLKQTSSAIPKELAKVKPFDFALNDQCVYVIFANGRSVALQQMETTGAIYFAWPICQYYEKPFKTLEVSTVAYRGQTHVIADMDAVFSQEFSENYTLMLTRSFLSTLVKEIGYYGSLIALAEHGRRNHNDLYFILAWIIGDVYRYTFNTADTRSWEMLPKEFQLTQLPMPKDRKLQLKFNGNSHHAQEIVLPKDCGSAIIFVSAPSTQNVSYILFPLK